MVLKELKEECKINKVSTAEEHKNSNISIVYEAQMTEQIRKLCIAVR